MEERSISGIESKPFSDVEDKTFYKIIAVIGVLLLFSVYWFVPLNTMEFNRSSNSNFSLNNSESNVLQFYSKMRFIEPNISYKILDCPLQKANDMKWAFDIIEQQTILSFYPADSNQQITITCSDILEYEGNFFTAGEGGPTNITIAGEFNVIESGKILLIKDSSCERPNVALHELLHVLGFDHSTNSNNIMYEISRCDQTIGQDLINFINEIYSIPAQPDLLFEDTSAIMHGKYLDIGFSIRNNGLKASENSIVKILVDGKEVKEIEMPPIEVGYGREISMTNIWVRQINIQNIEFIIDGNFEESNKINNNISFEIKK